MSRSQPNGPACDSRGACDDFWLKASEPSLDAIWDDSEDDIYAELLSADDSDGTSQRLGKISRGGFDLRTTAA